MEMVRRTPVWGKLVVGVALTSSAALFAFPSQATEVPRWEEQFVQKDSNKDGSLEWDEYRIKFKNEKNPEVARQAQIGADKVKIKEFEEIDSNEDELITKQEFRDYYISKKQQEFEGYDFDADGFVTLAEFVSPQSRESELSYFLNITMADMRYSDRSYSKNSKPYGSEESSIKVTRTPASVIHGRAGQVFRSADLNDDGKLDFGEFVEVKH